MHRSTLLSVTSHAIVALATTLSPMALAEPPHEHGTATLDVVLDGNRLLLDFESPLDNLVGFEHAPRSDKERAALKTMEISLRATERLLVPSAAAECRAAAAKVEQPFAGDAAGTGAKKESHGHSEAHVVWEFACKRPDKLAGVDVLLFDVFPGMKKINVQTASPRGQASATLTRARRKLSL